MPAEEDSILPCVATAHRKRLSQLLLLTQTL